MVIAEEHVAAVVADISTQLSDPAFAQERIGGFVETQPNAARFLTLSVGRKLGAEEAMHAVFHATVIEACFARAGVALAVATFLALDAVGDDPRGGLRSEQPSLSDYLATNVSSPEQLGPLCRVALCWSRSVALLKEHS